MCIPRRFPYSQRSIPTAKNTVSAYSVVTGQRLRWSLTDRWTKSHLQAIHTHAIRKESEFVHVRRSALVAPSQIPLKKQLGWLGRWSPCRFDLQSSISTRSRLMTTLTYSRTAANTLTRTRQQDVLTQLAVWSTSCGLSKFEMTPGGDGAAGTKPAETDSIFRAVTGPKSNDNKHSIYT